MNEKLRKEILARDGKCRLCDSVRRLDVHHIRDIIGDAYETEIPDLLIVLCRKCHQELHHSTGRRKWAIRRKLLLLYGMDIGFCGLPRWVRTSMGTTECEYCGVEKSKHGLPPGP